MTLGIDVGGTTVKAARLAPDGSATFAASQPFVRPDRDTLRLSIRRAVEGVGSGGVGSVGLCVPGRVAVDGSCVELSVNVPGLVGYRFDALVRDAVGEGIGFVRLGDAEAATLDAARVHPDRRRVLGLALGTGVGVALVEDGRPVRIGAGGIGHLGQVDVGELIPGGVVGPDGGRNSLEGYLGAPALRARFGEGPEALGGIGADDPAVRALARAVRIGLAVYTPDLVLVLGGVGLGLRSLAGVVEAAVRRELTSVAPRGWAMAFGDSPYHAALGAARWASASR